MPETEDLDLVAPEALARWMDAQGLPGAGEPVRDVSQLSGGAANVIFRLRRGPHEMVLRRPPRHPRPNSNRTMLREARVLAALRDTPVPHPRLIACCEDPDLIGATFYLMEPIEGFNPVGELPEPFRSDASARRRMGFELVDAIARLACVDYRAVGLEGFGKPDSFLERQVSRWRSQLESYRELDGYDVRVLPGFEEVASWLENNLPMDFRPGILHGDYQFANVMFAHDRPELLAVIDWELSTVGDPLLDLGWILCTWRDPGETETATSYLHPWRDFPTRAELIERYLSVTDRDPRAVGYFRVLGCYKLGILLEGNYARGLAGLADREAGEMMGRVTVSLFEQAHELVRQAA
ncbi:MAG: phosphotransferase family protein [Myxococcota bacterium]